MISFRDYIATFSKKFVCLYFDEQTNKSLKTYCKNNSFNLDIKYNGESQDPNDFDFHITLYYTWNKIKAPNETIDLTPFKVYAKGLDLFGEKKDVPVITIEINESLKALRDAFKEAGFQDTWKTWKPHVSLSYDHKKYDLSRIDPPDFPLVVCSVTVKDQ